MVFAAKILSRWLVFGDIPVLSCSSFHLWAILVHVSSQECNMLIDFVCVCVCLYVCLVALLICTDLSLHVNPVFFGIMYLRIMLYLICVRFVTKQTSKKRFHPKITLYSLDLVFLFAKKHGAKKQVVFLHRFLT